MSQGEGGQGRMGQTRSEGMGEQGRMGQTGMGGATRGTGSSDTGNRSDASMQDETDEGTGGRRTPRSS
jgi:hypothetical protein